MTILKSSSRSTAGLADHLLRTDTNETVTLREVEGTIARDVHGALEEFDARAVGTRCRRTIQHVSINPASGWSEAQWARAWHEYEHEFGLAKQPFVEVAHRKEGRDHRHRVYSRIDIDAGKAVPMSWERVRNEKVARIIEFMAEEAITIGRHNKAVMRRLEKEDRAEVADWMRAAGAHRVDRALSDHDLAGHNVAERRQQERTGIDAKQVRAAVSDAWSRTDDGRSFQAALAERGLRLARGDKAGIVLVVDEAGGDHELRRCLNAHRKAAGIGAPLKAAEIKARVGGIATSLPSLAQARDMPPVSRPEPSPIPQAAPLIPAPTKPELPLSRLVAELSAARTVSAKENALTEIEDRRREVARRIKAASSHFAAIDGAEKKLKAAQTAIETTERAFRTHLLTAYLDPAAAEAKWRDLVKADGLKSAMRGVGKRPDTLGALNGWSFLFIRTGDRNDALAAAKALPGLGAEARIALVTAAKARKELRAARAAASNDELYKIGDAARSELARVEMDLPGALATARREIAQMERDELRTLAARAIRFEPGERRGQLQATWTAPGDQTRWRELVARRGDAESALVLKEAWRARDPAGFAQWRGQSRGRGR